MLGAQAAFGRRAVAEVWRLAAGTRLDRPCALVEAIGVQGPVVELTAGPPSWCIGSDSLTLIGAARARALAMGSRLAREGWWN